MLGHFLEQCLQWFPFLSPLSLSFLFFLLWTLWTLGCFRYVGNLMVFVYPKSLCCLEYLDLGHVKSICLNFGIARASERENRECRAIC